MFLGGGDGNLKERKKKRGFRLREKTNVTPTTPCKVDPSSGVRSFSPNEVP